MRGKVFLTVVVLMCLAMVAQSALAQGQGRGSRESRGPGQGRGGAMMGRGGGMFGGLDLTEEQQAKMAKVREEIMEKVGNADPEARREIFGQLRDKMQAILTPEQREEMTQRFSSRSGREGGRPGGPGQGATSRTRSMGPIQVLDGLLRRLGLNKEQQTKIDKIREDAIKKLFKDVKAVLTKEQNTKLEEAQKRLRVAQQRRGAGRTGAGERPERRGPRRGEGDRDGGSRRGGGDREGGARSRMRDEGSRQRDN